MDTEVSVWTVVAIVSGMAILAQGNGSSLTSPDKESGQDLYIYPGTRDKEVEQATESGNDDCYSNKSKSN